MENTGAIDCGGNGKAPRCHHQVQPSPTSQEDPWPQIRSVIADLLKIDIASVASAPNRLSAPEFQPPSLRDGPTTRVIPGLRAS